MPVPFTFRPVTSAEVAAAYVRYEDELPGLGERFLHAVGDAAGRAAAAPEQYARLRGDIRRVLVRGFPYGVYYRVRGERVVVIAVQHLHQAPERWHGRR